MLFKLQLSENIAPPVPKVKRSKWERKQEAALVEYIALHQDEVPESSCTA
jgi:hypothetical protein